MSDADVTDRRTLYSSTRSNRRSSAVPATASRGEEPACALAAAPYQLKPWDEPGYNQPEEADRGGAVARHDQRGRGAGEVDPPRKDVLQRRATRSGRAGGVPAPTTPTIRERRRSTIHSPAAERCPLKAYASDLNLMAVLINRAMIKSRRIHRTSAGESGRSSGALLGGDVRHYAAGCGMRRSGTSATSTRRARSPTRWCRSSPTGAVHRPRDDGGSRGRGARTHGHRLCLYFRMVYIYGNPSARAT